MYESVNFWKTPFYPIIQIIGKLIFQKMVGFNTLKPKRYLGGIGK